MRATLVRPALWAILVLAAACRDDSGSDGPPPVLPDFSLTDVNPNSATYNQKVSPRDYLGKVSAWYFGHAT
ncbi:MAG: hypothetical protein ACK44W_03160 [Planctomycetota bacterium]